MASAMLTKSASPTVVVRSKCIRLPVATLTTQKDCCRAVSSISTTRHELTEVQGKAAAAMAGSIFSLFSSVGSAAAAQEMAEIVNDDARPLILLLVLGPALGWVLFNILQPALRQLNSMKGAKAIVGGVGISAAASLIAASSAQAAQQIAEIADDQRPLILLFVLGPAVGWVLFNILQPALRQLNNMSAKNKKGVIGGAVGLSAGALLAAPHADAAQQIAEIADDQRPLILLLVLGPAVGWVLFNILQPALRQLNNMAGNKKGK